MIVVRIACLIALIGCLIDLISALQDDAWEKHVYMRVKMIKKVYLWEIRDMLAELQDMAKAQKIRGRINYYIEKNTKELRNLDNKNELSDSTNETDNSK